MARAPKCPSRVALVTGAGRGLGRTIATSLAARDVRVALVARTGAQVEETAALIRSAGGQGLALTADLTDSAQVTDVFAAVEHELGPLDLLVNNAGACQAVGRSWELEPEAWWSDVAANLFTTYVCTRAALLGMTARRSGLVVNLGSESGVAHPAVSSLDRTKGSPAMTAYGSAKAAVHQFTAQLAQEVEPFGIVVVAIRPGPVRTSMTDAIAKRLGVPADSWLPWVDEGQGAADLVWRLLQGRGRGLNGHYIRSADELDDRPPVAKEGAP